jgi:hypothetical protein
MKNKIAKILKNRHLIFEGIKNTIFKKPTVEEVAAKRMKICKACNVYDETGEGCLVSGTQPCCSEIKGGCGCSLEYKVRSMSSSCPLEKPKWFAIMTQEEEDLLNKNQHYENIL